MAKSKEYSVGDIVQLKSGGPRMTVEEILYGGNIRCQWFSGSKLNTGDFDPGSIQDAKEEPPKNG